MLRSTVPRRSTENSSKQKQSRLQYRVLRGASGNLILQRARQHVRMLSRRGTLSVLCSISMSPLPHNATVGVPPKTIQTKQEKRVLICMRLSKSLCSAVSTLARHGARRVLKNQSPHPRQRSKADLDTCLLHGSAEFSMATSEPSKQRFFDFHIDVGGAETCPSNRHLYSDSMQRGFLVREPSYPSWQHIGSLNRCII